MKTSLLYLTVFSLLINMLLSVPMEMDKELESKTSSGDLIKSKSYVTADLTKVGQDVMTLRTCIGAPAQCFNLIFDTASFHMWVPSFNHTGCLGCKSFNETRSNSFNKEDENILLDLQYLTGAAVGTTGTDNIRIGTLFKNISLNFLVANTIAFDVKGADGIIGFGRNYNKNSRVSPKNSIVAMMKQNGLINSNVFSQKYVNPQKTRAKLFIGDIHEDFYDYPENVTSCKTYDSLPLFSNSKNDISNLWTCRMSHIIFGENDVNNFNMNNYPVHSKAIFDSGSNYILAPVSDIFPFKSYFQYIPECEMDRDTFRKITVFYCDPDFDVKTLDKISFVLNGTAYHIPPEDLFTDYSDYGFEKKVLNIFFLDNIEYWSLGQVFLKNFHVLFDHDKNSVSFFPLDSKYVSDVSSKTTDNDFVIRDYHALAFVLLLVLILATTSALIVYYLRKRRVIPANNNGVSYQLMEKSAKTNTNDI